MMGKAVMNKAMQKLSTAHHKRHVKYEAVASTGQQVTTARKVPLVRISHTPRTIRLACDFNSRRRAKPVALKPFQATSNAIVVRPTGQVSVWEEQVPQKLYMDYSGHCHAKLDDGGYLFMDQFGHCHKKLDDGGYLYMDNIGHCHKRLDDEVPQNSAPRASANHIHHPKPRSANKQRSLVAMLGDLTTADKSRDEQAAHDGELRQLQAKPVAMLGCNQQRVKINKATRQSHHISQPRRFN